MKPFEGFKSESSSKAFAMLPEGAYVATIKAAKVEGSEPDQSLIIRVDVAEGEWTGYFTKRYQHDSEFSNKYQPRYKGDFRLRIPNPANKKAMFPESDVRRFNDAIYRIEQSNPGYHWDWNEAGLKGLTIGINMQRGEYNGSPFTKIGRLEIVNDVRAGLVNTMWPQAPRSDAYEPPVDQQSGFAVVDEEPPF